jgi:hypothetical protein
MFAPSDNSGTCIILIQSWVRIKRCLHLRSSAAFWRLRHRLRPLQKKHFRLASLGKHLRLEQANRSSRCCSECPLRKINSLTAERDSSEVRACVVIGERIQSGLDPSPIWVSFVAHYWREHTRTLKYLISHLLSLTAFIFLPSFLHDWINFRLTNWGHVKDLLQEYDWGRNEENDNELIKMVCWLSEYIPCP